ncbi:MAG TPA: EAL domain-containing protein [Aeromonadales bacterium]|nr:EAL domain-containing protein [Aeromonadales bacterium]
MNIRLPDESQTKKKQAIHGSLLSLLETIVTIPWMVTDSAGIFSADPINKKLKLIAQINLPTVVKNSCAIINYSQCLCGKVAESEKMMHVSCANQLHENHYEGMEEHGHYIVPIKFETEFLGVLLLYVEHGHQYSNKEEDVLQNFAKTISYLLLSRQITNEKQISDLVLAHSNHGIMLTDESLKIVWVNKTFESITGYKCEEMIGNRPSILSSGKHEIDFYESMWQEIKKKGSWEGEIWNKRKNGEVYPELLNIIALKNSQDKVINYGAIFKDLSLIKKAEAKIHKLAYFDSLTGFANRGYFLQHLAESIKLAKRRKECLTLFYIDLDGFKNINDTLGHHIGDQLLAKIGDRLKAMLRETDFIARLGGDEFCILISNNCDEANAAKIAGNCLKNINKTVLIENRILTLKASIGIAYFPLDANNPADYLKAADTAMYESKIRGKNRFTFYSKEMTTKLEKRLSFEHLLRQALKKDEFQLYYQPKIDLNTGLMTGVEALIRWDHPKNGITAPVHFVSVLEKLGIIDKVGQWVMRTACEQLKQWHKKGFKHLQMAINISPSHFGQSGFISSVEKIIQDTGINPSSIEIEITESVAFNLDILIKTCQKLKKLGAKIAIDDFGTGYSSLSILSKLNIDTLKIDKLFIDDLIRETKTALMLGGILSLAKGLGYETVVEGVETREQVELLYGLGFKNVQGYYFSKPVQASYIVDLVDINFFKKEKG